MIKEILNKYRKKIILFDLMKLLSISTTIILIYITTTSILENIFYFNNKNREVLFFILLIIIFISISYIFFYCIIRYYNLFNNLNNISLSKKIGLENNYINDELINILQIENNEKANKDLISLAKKRLVIKLEKRYNEIIKPILPTKQIHHLIIFSCIAFFSFYFLNLDDSFYRIKKYESAFNIPTPFYLESKNGSFTALEGDSVYIQIKGIGQLPDSISLFIEKQNITDKLSIPKINDEYEFLLTDESKDIIYWSEFENPYLFSKWDKVSTEKDTIKIKSRPKIIERKFTITPPVYTKKNSYEHNDFSISQIEVLEGSNINLSFLSDNILKSAWLINEKNERIDLKTKENKILHNFRLNENTKFSIYYLNQNYISNINPTQYTLITKKDNPPQIIIKKPNYEFEIDEQYSIDISANILDDIGVENIWIEYSIFNPDFPDFNKKDTTILFTDIDSQNKKMILNKKWDIRKLNLLMGDELHFNIFVKDNNTNKKNITKSDLIIGKFPSIENIFSEISSNHEDTFEAIENIDESIDNISEVAEDIKLDLLKAEDLSWEEKQKLSNTFEDIEDIKKEISKMQNAIEKVLEDAESNNLFDKNLTEKFEQLQSMLQNIMSPELQEAINKLQDAMKNNSLEDTIEALENYEFNLEKFEEQIDRFIDMFELAIAEQKLNEISEYLENMINKQNDLINELINNDNIDFLNKKSSKQENRFSSFQSLLNEAESLIENISVEVSQEINNLINDSIMDNTQNLLNDQTKSIISSNKKKSVSLSNQTNKNLLSMLDYIEQIKKQFNDENKEKLSKEFVNIINSIFVISNQQEKIIEESKGLRSNSPKLKTINRMQFNIDQELIQITSQVINLSNKTFFINPKINRYIGQLKTSINKSISFFEQKQINNGKKEHKKIVKILNETIVLLLDSMQEMKNSQQTSGFEQFMESLEKISQGQKGVNQQTMQMGGMGAMGMMQQQIMEELQKKQQELKNKLEELIGNNPGQDPGGGLHQTTKEMDEIIKDLINKNITDKTIERQQRILSRMLDSQKSLTQKDFDKKRESSGGQNFEYTGPLGLPEKQGEKDLLLMKALEQIENENLSPEYNNLIQTYFLNMQNDKNENKE